MTKSGSSMVSSSTLLVATVLFLISANVTVRKVGSMPIPSTWPPWGSISRRMVRRPGLTGPSRSFSGNSRTRPSSISGRAMRDTAPAVRPTLSAIAVLDMGPNSRICSRTDWRFWRPFSLTRPSSSRPRIIGWPRVILGSSATRDSAGATHQITPRRGAGSFRFVKGDSDLPSVNGGPRTGVGGAAPAGVVPDTPSVPALRQPLDPNRDACE